ncbi:hypothetical protein [Frigidibacter oleivorans]|uniref:hypothetical protein n=1 Tax=Frigidibacter oleivorans TaxID=2487129 RepID=UPI000F8C8671|nr:hypothetical protein [Frigidibacter oleivorans]
MAIILQSTDWEIPEPAVLNLPGLQTDPHGQVMAGDLALFDFALEDQADTIAAGADVPGLIFDQDAGHAGAVAFTGVEAAKGLVFDPAAGTRRLYLPPAQFDLAQLGSEASLLISTWLTHRAGGTSLSSIIGHAYLNSSQHQWSLLFETGNTITAAVNAATSGTRFGTTVTPDVPVLLTILCRRKSAGTFEKLLYRDDELVAAGADTAYPFNSVTQVGANFDPIIGGLGSYVAGWKGTVHRVRIRKIDPENFDIDAYLAAEIAANAGRFAA